MHTFVLLGFGLLVVCRALSYVFVLERVCKGPNWDLFSIPFNLCVFLYHPGSSLVGERVRFLRRANQVEGTRYGCFANVIVFRRRRSKDVRLRRSLIVSPGHSAFVGSHVDRVWSIVPSDLRVEAVHRGGRSFLFCLFLSERQVNKEGSRVNVAFVVQVTAIVSEGNRRVLLGGIYEYDDLPIDGLPTSFHALVKWCSVLFVRRVVPRSIVRRPSCPFFRAESPFLQVGTINVTCNRLPIRRALVSDYRGLILRPTKCIHPRAGMYFVRRRPCFLNHWAYIQAFGVRAGHPVYSVYGHPSVVDRSPFLGFVLAQRLVRLRGHYP